VSGRKNAHADGQKSGAEVPEATEYAEDVQGSDPLSPSQGASAKPAGQTCWAPATPEKTGQTSTLLICGGSAETGLPGLVDGRCTDLHGDPVGLRIARNAFCAVREEHASAAARRVDSLAVPGACAAEKL
jgi:hypothetical protein